MTRILITFSLSVVLAGCISTSVPGDMVGDYLAANGDLVEIRRNGAISWSPPNKTRSRLEFIGIIGPESGTMCEAGVAVPSTSTFGDVHLRFSPDLQKLHVDWGQTPEATPLPRATEFEKAPRK